MWSVIEAILFRLKTGCQWMELPMKQCFSLFFLIISLPSWGQSLTDAARSNDLTWYGVDFTEAKFSGFGSSLSIYGLKDSLISAWSFSNVSEENSGMLRRQFGKKSIQVENTLANKRNIQSGFENALNNETHEISYDKVKEIVSGYSFKGSGYGVIIIVEVFDKTNEMVSAWVTYINKQNGQVITARRYRGIAGGIGMRYHWMQGIEDVIKFAGKDLKNYK
jgi:hypothetical protein